MDERELRRRELFAADAHPKRDCPMWGQALGAAMIAAALVACELAWIGMM